MKKPTVITLSIIIAAGIFYGGFAYGKSLSGQNSATNAVTFINTRGNKMGTTTGAYGGFGGGSATTGTVVSSDSTSVTVALKSGSVVVFYSNSTPILKTTSGTSADIVAGENITVIGAANSDGSITANSIQLRQATQSQ